MNYAIIENGVVVNVVVSGSPLADNWVRSDNAAIGDTYIDGEFIKPVPEPIPDPFVDSRITKLAFKQRLTQTERIAIRAASAANPVVYDFLDILDSATFVDLQRQDTIDGIDAMEAAGLLAAGRAAEVLNAPVQYHERFDG